MLILVPFLSFVIAGCGHHDCVSVPVGADHEEADWNWTDVEVAGGPVDLYCFCSSNGIVNECVVSNHEACQMIGFGPEHFDTSPIVLGDIVLSTEQERSLRDACEAAPAHR